MDEPTCCDCCAGIDAETPRPLWNRPGLSAIAYRVGRHAQFRESLVARLSSAELPALMGLRTREERDFTIACCDAFATMADVLTFYQERIAHEAWLRTATERRSVLELARLIGYELAPGVAAATYLAFTLEEARGARHLAALPVTIPVGTRAQSVPGPNEEPQTFETVGEIEARWEWNAIPAQTSEPAPPQFGDTELFLLGVGLTLKPGDALLLVGAERVADPGSERWDVRVLRTVEPDSERGITRVTWVEGLGHVSPPMQPAAEQVGVYVLRQRASLFGHNAPDPKLLNKTGMLTADLFTSDGKEWKNFALPTGLIDLDAPYQTIAPGSWLVLVTQEKQHQPSSFPGYKELYRASTVAFLSRSAFGVSGRMTRIGPDSQEHLDFFGLRDTFVLAESEAQMLTDRPVTYPVYGGSLALQRLAPDLIAGKPLAITGKRQTITIVRSEPTLTLVREGGPPVPLSAGDPLTVLAPPVDLTGGAEVVIDPEDLLGLLDQPGRTLRWRVADRNGVEGTVTAPGPRVQLAAPAKDDRLVSEIAFLANRADAVLSDRDRTTLTFAGSLRNVFARSTVTVNANVAAATHGETVDEILGSGDASVPDQAFVLRQFPLTYVSAPTETGRASTLTVRVNDLAWNEVPSLYQRGPDERVHTTRIADDTRATVRFGDGEEGARLPSGQDNVRARYRYGLGAAGNVRAGQLSTLLSLPLGVTSVVNPEPATGGENPERLADARRNAPISVLTLGRIVSRRDYEDYARTFPGIRKAHAVWIPTGAARGVFLSVAGPGGAAIPESGATYPSLVTSLRRFGDRLLPVRVRSHTPVAFRISANLKLTDDAEPRIVLPAVEALLRSRFSFDAREFGQPVTLDEVIAVIHEVPGVAAVDVEALYRAVPGAVPALADRLLAALPVPAPDGTMTAAEILTLHPDPVTLGIMQ